MNLQKNKMNMKANNYFMNYLIIYLFTHYFFMSVFLYKRDFYTWKSLM
jgi:hypothetical protein